LGDKADLNRRDREQAPMRLYGIALAMGAIMAAPLSAVAADAPAYKTSWEHYQALKAKAGGGVKLTFEQLPDWSGVWIRAGGFAGLNFDTNQPRGGKATAVLTPDYAARYEKRLAELAKGIERDPLAECLRPEEVWWVLEEGNEVRRFYLNGRPHLPDDEANAEPEGDSIGFWDGDALVVHTNHLRAGQYQKNQPDYSDQVTTVERLRKVDAATIEDDVTVYDPLSLAKPWHVTAKYTKVTNVPGMRLNYWPCVENNRAVTRPDGTVDVRLGDLPPK
jgi:hypothetical protein